MIKVLAETSWATPEHHCFYIEHRLVFKRFLSNLHFWYLILTMVEKTEYLSHKTTPEAQFQLVSEINTLFYISLITIAVVVNYD